MVSCVVNLRKDEGAEGKRNERERERDREDA
jgi:hypothetical protein